MKTPQWFMIVTSLLMIGISAHSKELLTEPNVALPCEDLLRMNSLQDHSRAFLALSDAIDETANPLDAKMLPGLKLKAKEAFGLTTLFKDELQKLKVNAYFEETDRHAGATIEIYVNADRGIDQLEVFDAGFNPANIYKWSNDELGVIFKNQTPNFRKYMSVQNPGGQSPQMILGVDVACEILNHYIEAGAKAHRIQTESGPLCRVPVLQILLK